MSVLMIMLAVIGGMVVGAFIGFLFVVMLGLSKGWYRTKRECRECLRMRVEHGFYVDGKEYECVERKK